MKKLIFFAVLVIAFLHAETDSVFGANYSILLKVPMQINEKPRYGKTSKSKLVNVIGILHIYLSLQNNGELYGHTTIWSFKDDYKDPNTRLLMDKEKMEMKSLVRIDGNRFYFKLEDFSCEMVISDGKNIYGETTKIISSFKATMTKDNTTLSMSLPSDIEVFKFLNGLNRVEYGNSLSHSYLEKINTAK